MKYSKLACLLACFAAVPLLAQEPKLPKVVLMGDSIRLGYTGAVKKKLEGKAVVVSPGANGGDSSNVLKGIEGWAIKEKPDIVHFNCGIHDTKKSKSKGTFQVSPQQYEENLRKIVERIRKDTGATVIFATTTFIEDAKAAKSRPKTEYELLDASIRQYNDIARKVMEELKVPITDLYALSSSEESRAKWIGGDGTHYSAEGSTQLGNAVAESILKHKK